MKHVSSLPLFPARGAKAGKLLIVCLGIMVAAMLPVLLPSQSTPRRMNDTLLDVLLCASAFFQWMIVTLQCRALTRAIAVLHAQRTPDALWQAWLRQWLATVTRHWLLLCAGAVLPFLLATSAMSWLAAPALLSLMLSTVCTALLARAGLLPRVLWWSMQAVMLMAALSLAVSIGGLPALTRFGMLPPPLLAACVLAWPAMAWRLLARHGRAVPALSRPRPAAPQALMACCARWAKRWVMRRVNRYVPLRLGDGTGLGPNSRQQQWAIFALLTLCSLTQLQPMAWGEDAGMMRVFKLCVVSGMLSSVLMVRDLHWRAYLVPGGVRQRHFGWRIVASTVTLQLCLCIPVALALAAMGVGMGNDLAAVLHGVAQASILAPELVFCTALAAVLHTLSHHKVVGLIVLIGMTLLGASAYGWFGMPSPPRLWHAGAGYALFLACGTGVLVLVANRRWSQERLLAAMQTN